MKPKIHPNVHKTSVSCSCGNKFDTLSTRKDLRVEICSQCHPFYTGKIRQFTGANVGRVEAFRKRYGLKAEELNS